MITRKAHNSSRYLVMCLNCCFTPELQTHATAARRIEVFKSDVSQVGSIERNLKVYFTILV